MWDGFCHHFGKEACTLVPRNWCKCCQIPGMHYILYQICQISNMHYRLYWLLCFYIIDHWSGNSIQIIQCILISKPYCLMPRASGLACIYWDDDEYDYVVMLQYIITHYSVLGSVYTELATSATSHILKLFPVPVATPAAPCHTSYGALQHPYGNYYSLAMPLLLATSTALSNKLEFALVVAGDILSLGCRRAP